MLGQSHAPEPMPSPAIHLISDSTGETLTAMARASLARFQGQEPELLTSVFVRSEGDLAVAVERIEARPGLVCFTIVDTDLRASLERACTRLDVPSLCALDPLVAHLSHFLGRTPTSGIGRQHVLDKAYFQRMAALDYAMASDDGALGSRLARAEVILTGVSRVSKTPTCVYLAHRGLRAANVPLVPGRDLDPAFFEAMKAGIPVIGLTASPARLAQVRTERLEALGDRPQDYADIELIRAEVAEARLFFERYDLPVIDVTRRSVEETAAAILARLDRQGVGRA